MRSFLRFLGLMLIMFVCACRRDKDPAPPVTPIDSGRPVPSAANDPATAGKLSSNGVHSTDGWTTLPVTITLPSSFDDKFKTAFRAAMSTWNRGAGKDLFVAVEEHISGNGDELPSLYSSLSDNSTIMYFLPTRWLEITQKSKAVLATTIWENSGKNPNAISRADILFNTTFYRFGDATKDRFDGNRPIVDLESIALHELGHLLGLAHIESNQEISVMNPSFVIGDNSIKRALSPGDVSRIRSIYSEKASSALSLSAPPDDIDAEDTAPGLQFSY